ncbi:hypothetical protein HaLaN_32873, partial [Haematococcus lacustris]
PLLLARSQLPRLRSLLDRLLRLTPPLPAPLLAASAASRYLAPDTIISDTDLVLLKVVPPPDTAGPAAGQGIDPRWAAVQRRLFYWVSLANDPEEAIKGTLTSEAGSRDVERQAAHLLSDLALNPLRQGSWERLGQLYHKAL